MRVDVDPDMYTVTTTELDAVYVGAKVGTPEGAAVGLTVGYGVGFPGR